MLSKAPFTARARPSPLALLFLMLLAGVLAVSGCNTVSGVGEDISAAGRGIDQTSEATQEKMSGEPRTQQQQQQRQQQQQQRDQDYQSGRY